MKKILLLSFMLMMTSMVFAQVSLRPQAGINFASFSDDLADKEWAGKAGYQFGFDVIIGKTIYLQPGLNYQVTKLKIKGLEGVHFTSSRVNLPLAVGMRLFEGDDEKAFGMRAYAGPNLSVHVNGDVDSIAGITSDDIQNAHLSGFAGLGFDVSILFVDFTYQFGLHDYIDNSTLNASANKNLFMINAGLRIGF